MNKRTRNTRKFLFITSFTLPETAGSGIHAFRFARYINRKGDYAEILTFNRNLRLRSSEKIDEVRVIRIPYFNRNLFLKLCSLPFVVFYYFKYILRNNIVFTYGGKIFGFELIIILSYLLRKKNIFRSLMLDVDDLQCLVTNRNLLVKFIYHRLFEKVNIYFSINKTFSERFLKIYPSGKKIFEMPQGVDTTVFFPITAEEKVELRQKLFLSQNKFIILSVGFLIHRKGFEEIFSELAKLTFDFQYIIAGEHDVSNDHFLSGYENEMNYLKETGIKLLGDRISFAGYQQNLSPYYQTADIFLLNSGQEGLPNVLLEAMACELPVVTNSIQGVDGFLTQHRQNVIVFHNLSEIHDIIHECFQRKGETNIMAKNAYDDIRKKYSFDRVYAGLLETLKD